MIFGDLFPRLRAMFAGRPVSPARAQNGQALVCAGGVIGFGPLSSISGGDVVGPGSATDNEVPRYDGTTGKLIQGSGVTIDDLGTLTVATVSAGGGVSCATLAASTADSGTTNVVAVAAVSHSTSGTPAAGFGVSSNHSLTDTSGSLQTAAEVIATWVIATHGSRKARVVHAVYDTASREYLRGEASGSTPMIGFLGASASAALSSPDLGTLATTFGLATGTPTFDAVNLTGSVAIARLPIDTDGTLAANSDSLVPTQKAVKTAINAAITGLFDFKGTTDCSGNPNYPAASKGDIYAVSVAGKIGGASGTVVEVGDWYIAEADNAGGTEASVGTSWGHLERNLVGALISGGALGTPSSGTLTNCTGLPQSGTVGLTTADSPQFTGIELGHASDTTLTRSAAGRLAVEGVDVVTLSASQTLTNKTLTSPTLTTPACGTPSAIVLTNATGLPPATGLTALSGLTPGDPTLAGVVAGDTSGTNKSFEIDRLLGLLHTIPSGFRLSLTTAVPVTTSDVTGATSLYLTPCVGNHLRLYDGTRLAVANLPEFGLALGTVTSGKPYDVFAFTSAATPSSTNTSTDVVTFGSATGWQTGAVVYPASTAGGLTAGTAYWYNAVSSTTGSFYDTLAHALSGGATGKVDLTANVTQSITAYSLESLVWTNDTTRATAVTIQDGAWCKSGDQTRLYVGSFYTTSTTATEDSAAKRLLFNAYNRRLRPMGVTDSTASWNYTTAAYRQANGTSANQLAAMIGLAEDAVKARVSVSASNTTGSIVNAGIGVSSSTVNSAKTYPYLQTTPYGIGPVPVPAEYEGFPGVGYYELRWLEWSTASGTTTWSSNSQAGIVGEVIA